MKVFITGATGFIGRNLAERLIKEGHEVSCGIRSLSKLKSLSGRVRPYRIYLEYKDTILRALKEEKPEAVYHCAALVESVNIEHLMRVNAEGTGNVFDACLDERINKVIYLSSVAVVSGNPEALLTEDLPYKASNPYGRSKIEAERIALECREKGLRIAIIRPCMVYGEGEPHTLCRMVSAIKKRLIPVLGSGKNRLHLVSVENVVDLLALCLSKKEAYEGTYFIADKEILSAGEVLRYVAETVGAQPPFTVPGGVVSLLMALPIIGKHVRAVARDRSYSIERLKKRLGYIPRVSVYDGLKRAVLACER